MTTYAITLNWNSCDNVIECVASLKSSDFPVERIVIVDNGSADKSGERLRARYEEDKQVHVISNKVNEGFAGAVNIGMRYALSKNATHIFLINNDAVVDAKCLDLLGETLRTHPGAGAAAPTVFYKSDSNRVWFNAGYFSYFRANIVAPEQNRLYQEIDHAVREVEFLSGCALLLTAEMLQIIGMFDTDYFFYGEDVDFSLRAIRRGYKLFYVPEAKVWHRIDHMAMSRSSAYVLYHRARSLLILFRKQFSPPYLLYAVALHILLYTPYRFLQSIRGQTPLKSFAGWIRGTMDGLFHPSRNWVGK